MAFNPPSAKRKLALSPSSSRDRSPLSPRNLQRSPAGRPNSFSQKSPPTTPSRSFPSPSHQQSPSTHKKADFIGYLVVVGEIQAGLNHKYFDIKLNIASGELLQIRVMLMNLVTDFKDASILYHAIKLVNVSLPTNKSKTYFYNEKYGGACEKLP